MKLQQICNCVSVVAVAALLALAVFIGGCQGVDVDPMSVGIRIMR
jgi:hypothetical protein